MAGNQEYINELLQKIEMLSKKQELFNREIFDLKNEVNNFKIIASQNNQFLTEKKTIPIVDEPTTKVEEEALNIVKPLEEKDLAPNPIPEPVIKPVTNKIVKPKGKSNLEKFIGENLINKIGIIILIIGVGIGAKYSIDNDLISPLTRIILGYIMGISLIGLSIKLKKKYENFSAVLISGAMAILYFITFLGYSLYDLMPQAMTFGLMVLFTLFTVVAAIQYNKQVIAHIGLVGAYAVPFLLSNGSGQVAVLFSYMTIINFGILFIAVKRYWKPLYYSSFIFTWLIYIAWYISDYETDVHFGLAIAFLIVFFTTFYCMFLFYKLRKKEFFGVGDVILQLINAFVFYGLGLSILSDHPIGEQLLGVFTLANAIVHFIVSVLIYKLKLADKNLFYFTSGMVLVFISIAFPVQLDGNWVTLLWAAEAALLFWIGRTKKIPIYEKLAYPIIAVTFFSILQDWWLYYIDQPYISEELEVVRMSFFNISMFTSLFCASSFGFIIYLHRSDKYPFPWPTQKTFYKLISLWISSMFLFILYVGFFLEILDYLENKDFLEEEFVGIWLINYTLAFFTVLSFINIKKIKNVTFGYINILLNLFSIFLFLTISLYLLSELRELYLNPTYYEDGDQPGLIYIGIRYISLAFSAGLLIAGYKYVRQHFFKSNFTIAYDIVLQIAILWIISSELIHWLDMAGNLSSDKLGLSILWGVYALLLVVLGFWKKRKHIRIIAFVLFAITLVKLFFYDIADLTTIAKTIVFVSLGVLLLIISFLYNKYKHIITDEDKD